MEKLLQHHQSLKITHFLPELTALISSHRELLSHPKGNVLKYTMALQDLPVISHDSSRSYHNIDTKRVGKGTGYEISDSTKEKIRTSLMRLAPWRKGPFEMFGIEIDSEWQSWMKWNRFIDKIAPLQNRRILDIGSSNGYYMFRMAAHNPVMILGLEPQYAFYFQYLALQRYLNIENVFCLPVTFDELPVMSRYFDTVFCMGVLYHRKSPIDMLKKINDLMRPGGELILENLIIESDEHICLFPEERYAKMRNVFFIPSLNVLKSWLKRTGFGNIKCLDICRTEPEEQRKTPWIQTESLTDFLDPEDPSKTIEGYPSPVRAILSAKSFC
ncbi:MAG: tRNA 5-methoxyuridine(34)/uridine 5-oxyacetic acid(34) synthase CmoB [Desulfamplus sp.]|nr:tRNA 5-methoxyuridine(34)/uridine 5-oxyacetic acid(34) synthase CmoB [Desulfamplus sp.]